MYNNEYRLAAQGRTAIAGIDEAGRGPLAGPVVAAAVILPLDRTILGINDSKKLSHKKRARLYIEILAHAHVGIGVVAEPVIDDINILQASRLAMKRAVEKLPCPPDFLLIDGNMNIDLPTPAESIIGGDAKSASIAAASIIAKETRDAIMLDLHERYPQYEFDAHKGYPTKKHCALLEEHGPSPVHRKSFGPVRRLYRK